MGKLSALVYDWPGLSILIPGLGYLLGPTFGSALFSLTHPSVCRGKPGPLEVMDREFYTRMSKKRGDPALQSANNPSPDFYGEKVGRVRRSE